MALGQIDSGTLANSIYNSSGLNARKNAQAARTSDNAAEAAKSAQTGKASESGRAAKTSDTYGKTIGDPTLSEDGAKYYEQLKSKFKDMEFVLVSQDNVDQAEKLAARFANTDKTIVLIDEDKVDKMAQDEDYRAKYEGIIENSGAKLDELAASLEKSGMSGNVLGYGMQVNDDGTTSFFAVMKDSSKAQKERIEKKAAENKQAKKVEAKKAEKKRAEKLKEKKRTEAARTEAQKEKKAAEDAAADVKPENDSLNGARFGRGLTDIDKLKGNNEDLTVIKADSIEALTQKVSDAVITAMSNNILSEQEKAVGQNFDMKF